MLTGRSVVLDPKTCAVRPDLADIRLAAYVFAPHYAESTPRRVRTAVELRENRAPGAPILALLTPGGTFEMLDLVSGDAWGTAVEVGLVGYVAADALVTP